MRTRDEVLREFDADGVTYPVDVVDDMADRIRELEAEKAASEPVAWAIVNRDGVTMDVRMTWAEAREHSIGGDTLRPLVFGDVAHPSAAAVTVTDAMSRLEDAIASGKGVALAFTKLKAALTAASEGASA